MKRDKLIILYKDFKKDITEEFARRDASNVKFQIFGSVASTKKRNPSDIDVLVILPKVNRNKFNFLWRLMDEIQYKMKYQKGIHAFLLNGNSTIDRKLFRAVCETPCDPFQQPR